MFAKGADAEQGDCLAPSFGLQFFGHVAIDGESETMTVTLRDVDDNALWQTTISPKQRRTRRQNLRAAKLEVIYETTRPRRETPEAAIAVRHGRGQRRGALETQNGKTTSMICWPYRGCCTSLS